MRLAGATSILVISPWLVWAASTLSAEPNVERLPRGLPVRPAAPEDNPVTPEKVSLGRRLFFDPILSGDRSVSCASCHIPDRGFASPDAVAVGIRGQKSRRHAPTVLNVAYATSLFWDGRAASLEEQALMPIADPREMGSSPEEAVRRLQNDPTYVAQFRAAFGGEVTAQNLARAIASFERSLLTGDSPADRFRVGEVRALTEDAKQGLWLFEGRGGCWRCHAPGTYSDGKFHNTGVGWAAGDLGQYEVTKRDKDRGAFKTPGLRDVARTAPYMHDGSMATLEDVVRFYGKGGNPNPNLDQNMKALDFTEQDVRHLVAFLQALNGAPTTDASETRGERAPGPR